MQGATLTEKYNFKVSVNQFGQPVPQSWQDSGEKILLDLFEKNTLELKNDHPVNEKYTMIELGSNQSYYSLLFKHILGRKLTTNILVECQEENLERGKKEFKNNNCGGIFYLRSIGYYDSNYNTVIQEIHGNKPVERKISAVAEPITLNEILTENSLAGVDVLHSDIDGSELILLKENELFFMQGKTKHFYLITHQSKSHAQCKEFMQNTPYKLIVDINAPVISTDSLLFYKL